MSEHSMGSHSDDFDDTRPVGYLWSKYLLGNNYTSTKMFSDLKSLILSEVIGGDENIMHNSYYSDGSSFTSVNENAKIRNQLRQHQREAITKLFGG